MLLNVKIDNIQSRIFQNHIIIFYVHNMKLAFEIFEYFLRVVNKHINNVFVINAKHMIINNFD